MSPGFLSSKIFDARTFLKQITDHVQSFRHCETKDFQRKLVVFPSYAKDFSIPEFNWNTEGVPDEIFRRCETIFFEISDMPFSCIRFFDTRFFLKHRSVSPRKFLVLWDKKISTENSEIPFLSVSFFGNWFFLKQRRVAIRNLSGLWDRDFDKKSWFTPFFYYP